MAYERVQKSGWHSPIQKKQSQIVPPLIDNQTQADSLPASGVTVSGIPSKAQRDAIRRSLFEKWAGTGQIQAKLTIGEPGDKYEQEADRVASQVVNQINAPAPQQSAQSQSVQREAIPEEEDELQMKPEAGTIQREVLPDEEDELQMKSEAGTIQREVLPDEEELQMKPMVQCQAGGDGMAATPDMEASIQQARGSEQPLADNIREPMEQAFGADFSGVKIHTDAQADQLNQSIQARAFTTGQDVFFRQGEYKPESRGGQELLAHELTHVVQQGAVSKSTQVQSKEDAESEMSSISSMKGQASDQIQRATKMSDKEWLATHAAAFMMNKKTQNDGESADVNEQNKANASIWYNTLFSPGLDQNHQDYNEQQERVLKEQQAMLKRHFLAQAVFGVQGGTQFEKGKNGKPDKEENYQAIEKVQENDVLANLATLASGGGRFNYRSTDGSGDNFNKFLLFGNSKSQRSITKEMAKNRRPGGSLPSTLMGAYPRKSTHGESLDDGKIRELDKKFGVDATGFDIALGGVGLALKDTKGREVTTGYQGISTATRQNPTILSNRTKEYQTGHGLHRHESKGKLSLTQIAFEGSAPNTDNIHGGSHGIRATIGKKLLGKVSEKTLTGQDKRSKLGLPSDLGGIKSDVTEENLINLENYEQALEELRKTEEGKQKEKDIYKRLLTSQTQQERDEILASLIPLPPL